MRLLEIDVEKFGVWRDFSIEDLSDRVTVFYGPNEAGKTTLMQFVRAVLYGFSPDRRQRYLPPVHGWPAGGELKVAGLQGEFVLRRQAHAHEGPRERGALECRSRDGAMSGDNLLGMLLAGIDEAIFTNVFAVGLREFQELSSLSDTEASEQLYKLTTGMDRVSLVDVMRQLAAARQRLLAPDDTPSLTPQLVQRRDKLRQDIEQLTLQGRRWAQAAAQRAALEAEAAQAEQEIHKLEREGRLVEIAMQVRDHWKLRRDLDEQIARLGAPPAVPERAIETLDQLNKLINQRRERLAHVKELRGQTRAEAKAQPIQRGLWTHAAKIEALAEHAPWLSSLEGQIQQLQTEVAALELEYDSQCAHLGLAPENRARDTRAAETRSAESRASGDRGSHVDVAAALPQVSRRAYSSLKAPAKGVSEEGRRHAQAQADRDAARQEFERLSQELEHRLRERGQGDLDSALDLASDRVAVLRKRVQMRDRIEQLERRRDETDDAHHYLLDKHLFPWRAVLGAGSLCVFGAMLMLWGWVGPHYFEVVGGNWWAFLGLLCAGGGVALKLTHDRSQQREQEKNERQLRALELQIRQAQQEQDELDARIPTGGGALEVRLRDAEAALVDLEDLMPLIGQRQTQHERLAAAEARAQQAADSVKDARNRWKKAVQALGLPDNLSPKDLQNMARRSARVTETRRRLESRRVELEQRQQELASLQGRVDHLLRETETTAEGDTQTHLRRLLDGLNEQRHLLERRKALVRQFRGLRREQQRYERGLEKLRGRRATLLAQAGASDEKAFRQICQTLVQLQTLHKGRREVGNHIAAVLGRNHTEAEIEAVFAETADNRLETRRQQTQAQLKKALTRVHQLHEKRGELAQEMKALADDRRLAEAKLELGCVEEQLADAVNRWQVVGVTSQLLESIREIYENERQPETLGEASVYLKELTDGQYARLWTPLGEHSLRVDDAERRSLPLEKLSRGAREAIFLSLRLALAAAYARRGAVLPLVFDDVLVNLDQRRLKAAARVLRDFAKNGFQVLLFTCHEHIKRAFRNLKVDVRDLPSRFETVSAEVERDGEDSEPLETPHEAAPPTLEAEAYAPAPEYVPLPLVEPPREEEYLWTEEVEHEVAAARPDDREYDLLPPAPVRLPPAIDLRDDLPLAPEPEPAPAAEPVAPPKAWDYELAPAETIVARAPIDLRDDPPVAPAPLEPALEPPTPVPTPRRGEVDDDSERPVEFALTWEEPTRLETRLEAESEMLAAVAAETPVAARHAHEPADETAAERDALGGFTWLAPQRPWQDDLLAPRADAAGDGHVRLGPPK